MCQRVLIRDIHNYSQLFRAGNKMGELEKIPCIYATVPKHNHRNGKSGLAETLMYDNGAFVKIND